MTKLNQDFYDKLIEKIKPYFKGDRGHGFDHTQRVYNLTLKISEGEDIDLDIVKIAALLHDIARTKEEEDESICHAEEGVKIAKDILTEMDFPVEKINDVCYAIKVHRYSKCLKAETREAEILQDADRLDALGAMIISRVFMRNGARGNVVYNPNIPPSKAYHGQENSTAINHFYEKVLKLKPETFKTKKARKIAKERYNFVKQFVDRFIKEWDGEL